MALDKRYNPQEVEKGKYDFWLKNGYFNSGDTSKPKFSIVIPPPNVTGKLHLGHAWNTTIQDILIRYKKLSGFDTLWLPGMDHAGIATQAVVEAKLRKSGITRQDLGRTKFLEKIWEWKNTYATNIKAQWGMLGLALDYKYERFTLDEGLNKAVNKVFEQFYKEGLIYRGERIINWDPQQLTALSNIEVIHKEIPGKLYYFAYRLKNIKEPLWVATTRPETMYGDVCLVVNPKDPRYSTIVGKTALNPANKEWIPIIEDEYVDIAFGTGVMKCTPAHDPNDFMLAEKYGLSRPVCLNKNATMNEKAQEFVGLDRFECRKQLVEKLKNAGDLLKIDEMIHAVGFSERSDVIVEPYLSKQWFVRMKPLADRAIAAQQSSTATNFFPSRFSNTFISWMEKVEDWCISRQLWWGHQIPAYYRKDDGSVLVSATPPTDIENYIQDEDVLDTWFSSALWPFSTFGWPENTAALQRYYPVDVMITAYDIIFFWVSRMIFQGLHFTDKMPFKDVYIHGLIRDSQGRKMSKSLGNGVDPMDVISTYGADALRYFLATNSAPGQDTRYIEEKVASSSNYLNKIWNASRYIFGILPVDFKAVKLSSLKLNPIDYFILGRLDETIETVTTNIDKYELGIASSRLYDFVYDDFCSWYLELSKVSLASEDQNIVQTTHQVLWHTLKAMVLMIYPFSPFITEEIYQNLPGKLKSIMEEDHYPSKTGLLIDRQNIDDVQLLQMMIRDVRSFKVEHQLAPNSSLQLFIKTSRKEFLSTYEAYLRRFTFSTIEPLSIKEGSSARVSYVYVNGLMEIQQTQSISEILDKINKDIEEENSEISRGEIMLSKPGFILKASPEKVAIEKDKLLGHKKKLIELLMKKEKLND